jgi:phosphoenolpyruvate carboxylase
MTEHCLAVNVEVYPDEFKPIMKAIKYATLCDDKRSLFTSKELSTLHSFLDAFSDTALNYGI